MRKTSLVILLCNQVLATAYADNKQDQALGFCPLGIPAYNLLAVNYEKRVAGRHGLNLRLDYAPMSADGFNINDSAIIMNYRWYYHPSFDSFFAGVFSRYRVDEGGGTVAGNRFSYESKQFTLGLNAGKRWLWSNGITVVTLLGYGYNVHRENIRNRTDTVTAALDKIKKDYDLFYGNPLFGEFSVGYAF